MTLGFCITANLLIFTGDPSPNADGGWRQLASYREYSIGLNSETGRPGLAADCVADTPLSEER